MVSSIGMRPRKVGFSVDSPLEESGFELLVPLTPRNPYAMPSGCKNGSIATPSAALMLVSQKAQMLPLRRRSVVRFSFWRRSATRSDLLLTKLISSRWC